MSKKSADEIRKLARKYIAMNTQREITEALTASVD